MSLPPLESMTRADLNSALREFDDRAEDVFRSDHRTFSDNLKNLVDFQRQNLFAQHIYQEIFGTADYEKFTAEANASIGSMVGSGRFPWPRDPKARLFLQTRLISDIADGHQDILQITLHFYYAGSALDDNIDKFNEQFMRPYLREYRKLLSAIETKLPKSPLAAAASGSTRYLMDVFVSHSSHDADLARALVRLLRAALNLSPDAIRCTSVAGSKLPLGAATNEQIKMEVGQSQVFVALLTPISLKSPYVLFEMGARWGKGLFLGPLLARGATPNFLGGPITGINALNASSESDLHQFLGDIARELKHPLNQPAAYLDDLKAMAAEASNIAAS